MNTALFPLKRRTHYIAFCIIMAALLAASCVAATRLGSVSLQFDVIKKVVVNKLMRRGVYAVTWESSTEMILWGIRIPRILTAFIVGAGLTLCGILMQALTKNPLADPYVLGISHGASAGAVSVIMYGYLSFFGGYGTMVGAFLGAVKADGKSLVVTPVKNETVIKSARNIPGVETCMANLIKTLARDGYADRMMATMDFVLITPVWCFTL